MKRKLTVLIALIALIALMIPVFASAETVCMATSGGSLKLRKGPGTNYGVGGYVMDGDKITVLSKGSVWSKVENASGKVGYIKNLYISGNGKNYADGTTYFSSRYTGTVTTKYSGSNVNLRAGASTSTAAMSKLKSGTKVTVLGENGSFYLISKNGTEGFIHKNYIKKSGGSTTTKATVTASVLYMRSGAGKGYSVVIGLSKGTEVSVLSTSNSQWWKVKYGSHTGYMSSKYLKK